MKKFFVSCALCIFSFLSFSQTKENYWQQHVEYDIKVELKPAIHELAGDITLIYTNNSPDKLEFIWFHLWPNAYKDATSALYRQLSKSEGRKAKISSTHEPGFIDQLNWQVNGSPAKTEMHPEYNDVVKLILPKMLLPGEKISISTPFRVKLPDYFSRMGYNGSEYMISQWYPKPAVYDQKGWHPIPYLDMGEFYSEFGSFKVAITLPSNYVVAATGSLQDTDEYEAYKKIGTNNYAIIQDALKANDTADHDKIVARLEGYRPSSKYTSKTLHYSADSVHDFAWFADSTFIINYSPLLLYTRKTVDAFTFYHRESIGKWMMSCDYLKDAVTFYTVNIGEYPYAVVNVAEGPYNSGSGGMEYPMVTLITQPDGNGEKLDATITHEVGHNWFYGILGSNERYYPWMDEGMNSFFQFRYEVAKYRENSILDPAPESVKRLPAEDFERILYKTFSQFKAEDKINKPAFEYETDNDYGLCVYLKTAMWMYLLEKEMGKNDFQKGMEMYFAKWKFKHPAPDDFRIVMEEAEGKSLKKIFKLLDKTESFEPGDF